MSELDMGDAGAGPLGVGGIGDDARVNPHSQRVSWAECFFDLIFVFAVTQVATATGGSASALEIGRALVLFVPFWWGWVGTAVLINGIEISTARRHLLIFAIGLGAFVMSIVVPGAYHRNGVIFGLAYLGVRVLLGTAMLKRGRFPTKVNPYSVSMFVAAPLFVVGGVSPMPARAWIWLVAAAVELVTPVALGTRLDSLRFDAAHLPERFGLFVIIALGEALVGIGIQESKAELGLVAISALILAFALTCALWWTYFHFAAPAIEYALREARIQTVVVRSVLSHGHLMLVIGLILIASGTSQAVRTPLKTPHGTHAYFLGIGVSLYLLTFCYTRIRMFGGAGVPRLVGGLLAAAAAALGPVIPSLASLGVLVAIIIALNLYEAWAVATGRGLTVIRIGRGVIPA